MFAPLRDRKETSVVKFSVHPRMIVPRLRATRQFPNFLTLVRMLLFWVPAMFIVLYPNTWVGAIGGMASFGLVALTDYFDGHLARSWEQVSNFGKFWDPMADKLLVGTALVALCWSGVLASPLGWIFTAATILREVIVSLIRFVKSRSGRQLVIPANKDGKLKMNFQTAGILLAMAATLWPPIVAVAWVAFGASLYFSSKSAYAYIKA